MGIKLRVILLLGSMITAIWILRKIRKNRVRQEDALYWLCFAILLALIGLFPQIAYLISDILGIRSPANLVFLTIIALLAEKIVSLSIQISTIESRVENIAAEVAFDKKNVKILEKEIKQRVGSDENAGN